MDVLSDRPNKLTVAELIALKSELAKARKTTKKVRAWLAFLGIPEEELPELSHIKSTYTFLDRELIRRCPCVDTGIKTSCGFLHEL